MNFLDQLQQAWQSQRCTTPAMNPDQLLKGVRWERRVLFWTDLFMILIFLCVGAWMSWSAFRDIHKGWPWLISVASDIWVVGFILFNRWRRRRLAAHYDESVLAHVEWSIKDIEHRLRQDRNSLWWYVLPIALGCMIPPVFFFAMERAKRPLSDSLVPCLVIEGVFAAVFCFAYWIMEYGKRTGLEVRRRELEALRALRETLLDTEE
jgi:hypothetical protein